MKKLFVILAITCLQSCISWTNQEYGIVQSITTISGKERYNVMLKTSGTSDFMFETSTKDYRVGDTVYFTTKH